MKKRLNKELVIRLIKYRRILHQLKSLGFERVFSNNLGDAIGVAPALVRKDFSLLFLGGNKRGGYNIDYLSEKLDYILGKAQNQRIIIVGMGKIGTALAQYKGFIQGGFEVAAGFDIDPSPRPDVSIPIFPPEQLGAFVQENAIKVAVLAVPEESATFCVKLLKEAQIQGILNFTPVELKSTRNCVIHNINIAVEIENLFFQVIKNGEPPEEWETNLPQDDDELWDEDEADAENS
jgi:redox-sensing transcriptional repressor